MKLKFFSKVWCQPATRPYTAPEDLCPAHLGTVENVIDTKNIEPNVKDEVVAVYSTESDRMEFNKWYSNQVDKRKTNLLDSKAKLMSNISPTKEPSMFTTVEDVQPIFLGNNMKLLETLPSGSRKDDQSDNLQVLTTSFAKPNQAGTKTNVGRQQLWPGLCHRPSFLQSA